ncbi:MULTISPECIES: hypothetical protein [unclassified Mesorhizobium]|uniref:hypothetical protein n=1 Tax=unclassified Mesorhizobium TaxID=325217 RepID=UPI002416C784|nr:MULTISPECIES: hypothetical protein [unclassified Mesorhizobium]MDG4900875.1 hypothetical protein [Mesorhizobium sp. WSM4962]
MLVGYGREGSPDDFIEGVRTEQWSERGEGNDDDDQDQSDASCWLRQGQAQDGVAHTVNLSG